MNSLLDWLDDTPWWRPLLWVGVVVCAYQILHGLGVSNLTMLKIVLFILQALATGDCSGDTC